MSAAIRGCALVVVTLQGVVAAAADPAAPADISFNGVTVHMEERAHDGTFPVAADRAGAALKFDANSTLALRFNVPDDKRPAVPTPEWKALERALTALKDLTADFARLSAQSANVEQIDLAVWRRDNIQFGEQLAAFLELLAQPELQTIAPSKTVAALRRQASLSGRSMYGPLGELLEGKRREMIDKAKALGAQSGSDTVSVVAYVIPRSGMPSQVHVPEYDDIDAKPVRPITRNKPILSAAEQQRLRMEYAGAQAVSSLVSELVDHRRQIGDNVQTLARKLADEVKVFGREVKAAARQVDSASVTALSNALAASAMPQAQEFAAALNGLNSDIEELTALAKRAEEFAATVRKPDALEVVLALQQKSRVAADIRDALSALPAKLALWPARIKTLAQSLEKVAADPAIKAHSELLTAIDDLRVRVRADLDNIRAQIDESVPALASLLQWLADVDMLSSAEKTLSASEPFDPAVQVKEINLYEAKDTAIDLRRTGMELGDEFEVKVHFRSNSGARRDTTLTYSGEALLTCWHRRYSGDVIFSRAASGAGSDGFKPNAAVSLEWHNYQRRHPESVWNWLDPGFGFHAANLDQDQDQNVELGAGVNFSLWNGLLRFGYGYNLSVKQDHGYYWIGFGLFGMLNRLNELPSAKP